MDDDDDEEGEEKEKEVEEEEEEEECRCSRDVVVVPTLLPMSMNTQFCWDLPRYSCSYVDNFLITFTTKRISFLVWQCI